MKAISIVRQTKYANSNWNPHGYATMRMKSFRKNDAFSYEWWGESALCIWRKIRFLIKWETLLEYILCHSSKNKASVVFILCTFEIRKYTVEDMRTGHLEWSSARIWKGKNNVIPSQITKMSAWQTRNPVYMYTRGGIRCLGAVSIPCWPVTPAVSQQYKSGKRSNTLSKSVYKNGYILNWYQQYFAWNQNDNSIFEKCYGSFENLWVNLWFLITIRRFYLTAATLSPLRGMGAK